MLKRWAMKPSKPFSEGFTLIECLIVLSISSMIITGLFAVYLNIKTNYLKNTAMQEILEDIHFVTVWLDRAVQGAGYLGLSSWRNTQVYSHEKNQWITTPVVLLNEQDSHLPENIREKMKPNTQAIEIQQMDFKLVSLSQLAYIGETAIEVLDNKEEQTVHWENGDSIIVASSGHAEINRIVSIAQESNQRKMLYLQWPLKSEYPEGSYVGPYRDRIYFVGNTGRNFLDGKPIYGLYVYTEAGMTEEVSELISNIIFWAEGGQDLARLALLKAKITLTVPYLINGKQFSKEMEYDIAFRE